MLLLRLNWRVIGLTGLIKLKGRVLTFNRGTYGEGDTAKGENEDENKGNAMEKGDQVKKEGREIGRKSNREGKGEGSSGDDLTERVVNNATREGDEAKSENKKQLNQKYYQSHKKTYTTCIS